MDLANVGPGFAAPAAASQSVFRSALAALSRPGRILEIAPCGQPAARALLLSLLDQDTRLWLSPGARPEAAFLRFHTGCSIAETPAAASFALVAAPDQLPALDAFEWGSDDYPDRSTTLIVEVEALDADGRDGSWRLSGPGIRGETRLAARGLGPQFLAMWAGNHKRFPRGVDLLLTCGARLAGLPRTTRIED